MTVVESSISDGGEPLNYPEGEAGRIGWRLGTLKPGESRTVSFSAILDEGLAGGIEVTTSATIATASVPSASASVTNLVRAPSHVQVTVDTLRSTVTPGELALFRVTVRVIGSAAASGVAVSQTLPDSLEFAHATSGGSHAAGTTSWALGTLPGNSQTEMLVGALLVAGPAGGTEVETTVDATADDPVVPPDVANPHDAEVVVTASANLVVTKTPSVAVAGIGDEITYTVQVTNTGDGAASDVAVVDELPGALAFVSADSGGQFAGGTVAWQLASLGPGETKLLHVRAKVVQAGDISNGVTASGTNVSGAGSSSSTTAVTASATSAVVSSASLPFTGVNALEFVAIALAAIAAGLGLVALSMSHSSNMRNHFD